MSECTLSPLRGATPASQTIRLADGRRLGFAEWGDPAGRPVFLFHGTPGSRLSRYPDESLARARGVRVITVDRPGYGLSDFQPGRRLLSWPDDVAALADALELPRFAIVGVSGGGPHALACAVQLPPRLTAVALVGGAGPMDRPGAQRQMLWFNRLALRLAPWLPRWSATWPTRLGYGVVRRSPQLVHLLLTAALPATDRAVLCRPAVMAVSLEAMAEAFRTGTGGLVGDVAVLARPWGLRLAAIRVPVYLWHGAHDRNVPIQTGRYLARAIPTCRATFCPDLGHELLYDHWAAILEALAGHADML
ncbi:MAG TPA: alpha/beta hydrolase [Chloroflexia bacterium]|nr:alpha/beta hydrolase [Chloroflexia bacterium]